MTGPQRVEYCADEIHKLVNTLSPGDDLPSEEELRQRFDVSRDTIHRALQQLVTQKIIESRGRGNAYKVVTFTRRPYVVTPPGQNSLVRINEGYVPAKSSGIESRIPPADIAGLLEIASDLSVITWDLVYLIDNRVSGNSTIYFAPAISAAVPSLNQESNSDVDALLIDAGYTFGPSQDHIRSLASTPEQRAVWKAPRGVDTLNYLRVARSNTDSVIYVMVTELPSDRWDIRISYNGDKMMTILPARRNPID